MDRETFKEIYYNKLTSKQRQALQGFLSGLSDLDIAYKMDATNRATATKHLTNVGKKFGYPPEIEPDYRFILVELFTQYLPELVSKKVLDRYGLFNQEIRFPEGTEPLGSPFYELRSVEESCYAEIQEPGALIRVKAPKKMGKTSLIKRILARGKKKNFKTVYLNFSLIEKQKMSQQEQFLKSFFDYILLQLSWPDSGERQDFNMLKLTHQLEILLKQIPEGIILALDEIDQLFEYPEIYQNFFPMLRYWNEQANESETWEKLRIVVAHSTEYYGKLDINKSPFNIGLPIQLVDLTEEQVMNLAFRHGLDSSIISPIMDLVGGHPYLIRLAFYYLVRHDLPLDDLLSKATEDQGIYGQHLRGYLAIIEANQGSSKMLKQVLKSAELNQLTGREVYQLESMGLIKLEGNKIVSRYRLYQDYFTKHL
ncbi:MAG: AAA-like domain-containing protein [Crocosphaera sp.]